MRDPFSTILGRREFVSVGAFATLGILCRREPASTATATEDVLIVQFSDSGTPQGTVRVPRVVKSDSEWKKQLTAMEYFVARERGTERPFTGAYWNVHDTGLFRCICCDTALFSSDAKFDSGTGWPSYWEPIAEENVVHGKPSGGFTESEVTCKRCDAHLGDLFDDGPKPTGLRYCIDSASLRFVKRV